MGSPPGTIIIIIIIFTAKEVCLTLIILYILYYTSRVMTIWLLQVYAI